MQDKKVYFRYINKWLPIIFGCQVYPWLNKYDTYGERNTCKTRKFTLDI